MAPWYELHPAGLWVHSQQPLPGLCRKELCGVLGMEPRERTATVGGHCRGLPRAIPRGVVGLGPLLWPQTRRATGMWSAILSLWGVLLAEVYLEYALKSSCKSAVLFWSLWFLQNLWIYSYLLRNMYCYFLRLKKKNQLWQSLCGNNMPYIMLDLSRESSEGSTH